MPICRAKTSLLFHFAISHSGMVVSGFLSSGLIEEGNVLAAGPLDDGSFVDVFVTSLQRHKVSRRYVRPGESSTLAVEALGNSGEGKVRLEKIIRKGMVLLSPSEQNLNSVCVFFQAHVFVMPNSCEISIGFQAMVYVENVRQCVSFVAIKDRESVGSNESASVILQFGKHAEFIRTGYRLLIQQGTTKAVGHVTQIFPYQTV